MLSLYWSKYWYQFHPTFFQRKTPGKLRREIAWNYRDVQKEKKFRFQQCPLTYFWFNFSVGCIHSRKYRQECFLTKRHISWKGYWTCIYTDYLYSIYSWLGKAAIFFLQLPSGVDNSGQYDTFPCYGRDSIAPIKWLHSILFYRMINFSVEEGFGPSTANLFTF